MSLATAALHLLAIVVAGQLIVAGCAKVSGLPTYLLRVRSRPLAWAIIAVDLGLGLSVAFLWPHPRLSLLAVAAFSGAGAVYKAVVVVSPDRSTCACSAQDRATRWEDVATSAVIFGAAVGLLMADVDASRGWSLVVGLLATAYVAIWAVAERRRRVRARWRRADVAQNELLLPI